MRHRYTAVVIVVGLIFAGCSSGDAETEELRERIAELEAAQSSSTYANQESTTTASPATTHAAAPSSTTTTTQTNPDPVRINAERVLEGLAAQGAPITAYLAYTAATDPNELLGRPGGYASKVGFTDERTEARAVEPFDITSGGSIEVYETSAGASARARYIRGVLDDAPILGNEYHIQREGTLLRLSDGFGPKEVAEYEEWLDAALAEMESGIAPPKFEVAADGDTAAEDVNAKPSDASPFLAGTFEGSLPDGEPELVSVVAQGTDIDSLVPIIVRNMTPDTVIRVEVAGTARDSSGSLVASGSSQGLKPNLVEPGEIAIGYVYFGYDSNIKPSHTFDYTVSYESSTGSLAQYENIKDLVPVEWTRSGRNIVTILSNDSGQTLRGPMQIYAACFNPDDRLVSVGQTFSDNDTVDTGSTVSAQIRVAEPCDSFLIAGSAFTE